MRYQPIETQLGPLLAAANTKGVTHLWRAGQRHAPDHSTWQRVADDPLFAALTQQLNEYANGDREYFDVPLSLRGTPFQQRVWQQLQQVNFGETASYGGLSQRIGKPSAARAVGAAVGRNPVLILVPCHRIVGQKGQLTGFAAGLDMKRQLLTLEGSPSDNNSNNDQARLDF